MGTNENAESAPVDAVVMPAEVGDYVLATKYSDGDPGDHWAVGFFAGVTAGRYDPPRYEVVDSNGISFRGNGFRRVKKIKPDVGEFLLRYAEKIPPKSKDSGPDRFPHTHTRKMVADSINVTQIVSWDGSNVMENYRMDNGTDHRAGKEKSTMSKNAASPAPSASVCSLAGSIAKSVHENWCGWRHQTGCIQFRVGTIHRWPDGQRIWLVIGGCTVEFLELLLEMDSVSRGRSVDRLSRQLRQFVETQVWSVPQ